MKKIFGFLICALLISVRVYAEDDIPTDKSYTFDRANVASILAEFIEDEKKAEKAADKYNELSNNSENAISAVDFVDVCVAGGMNMKLADGSGYMKCLDMFMKLIEMQNLDAGGFDMYCPATGNALKSITDKTQVGDVCGGTPDTYIEYGHVTLKTDDKNGQHKYVCTCTPQSCKDGYYWNKEKYQCSVKDKEGYCVRHIFSDMFNYGSGINTISKYDSEWSKTQKTYYNEKFAELDAQEAAFDKCVKYGTDNSCRIRGALAISVGKKYQVICNPSDIELKSHKTQQEEKDKKYKEKARKHTYYEVCGKDNGKTGGTEYCVDVFKDIEVQAAQAKNLAVEYAKVKYNDDIQCETLLIRKVGQQNYMKCTSLKSNVFYEFQFDDAKESNVSGGKFVAKEFARGVCLIYGGTPGIISESKLTSTLLDRKKLGSLATNFDVKCGEVDCQFLNKKVSKWGYKSYKDGSDCTISYDKITSKQASDDYYVKFDGYSLKIFHDGSVVKSWSAVSGRGKTPNDSRRTVCQTAKYQACEEIGPTPEGVYYISQNDIQYFDNITIGNFNSNSLLADRSGRAWGGARVLLKPDVSTELYNREPDMYIHGGWYAGSAGCIDLTNKILDFIDWFATQTDFSTLKVVVDYGEVTEICGKNCVGQKCSLCECKKEINSKTGETNCDYI